jgi:hypothetical protein
VSGFLPLAAPREDVAMLAFAVFFLLAEADRASVRTYFMSENYTATWGAARSIDPTAELDVCDGNGHGARLGWMRFRPGPDGVDVLSIRYALGWRSYNTAWPMDDAPVTVTRARMPAADYAALLRNLAAVDAVTLRPPERSTFGRSTLNFWASARVTAGDRTLVDLDWAGYWADSEEPEFARPVAAVGLAHAATKGLDFKAHTLTPADRAWASNKFARDWKRMKGKSDYWWVREMAVITIGVVGDPGAYPTLREILATTKKDRSEDASASRCVYYAINAVTRLTGKDVRDKPVEGMDIEKIRRKALDLLPLAK